MSEMFFEAKNISKSFVGVKALDDVDLRIKKGEIHCLIGENGSGKSTFIKIVGGVYKADSGTVCIEGKELAGMRVMDSIRAGIQIIYQDLSIFPNLSVAENISINQMLEDEKTVVSWSKIRTIAKNALKAIDEDIDLDARVEDLSMAKKQIIAISRAVTQNAKLIIMDEATSALTNEEVKHLFSIIQKLKSQGISTLFVSHKFNEVFEISENITILRDGKKIGTYPTKKLDSDRLSYIMTGREVTFEPYQYDPSLKQQTPLLSVLNLSRANQFHDISFDLHKGEILGIIGLIGSGRTETVQALFGLNTPDSGTIKMHGAEVNIRCPQDAIKHGIALLPEDRVNEGLFEEQAIDDNIIITVLKDLLSKTGLIDSDKRQKIGDSWIKKLSVKTPVSDAPVNSLSGGNQQRVVLAKWLATKPDVFILDGPTIGIDIGSKHTIHSIIRDLASEGMGIIMISDEISEIFNNCNRILLMYNGRIIKEVSDLTATNPDELFELVTDQHNLARLSA